MLKIHLFLLMLHIFSATKAIKLHNPFKTPQCVEEGRAWQS